MIIGSIDLPSPGRMTAWMALIDSHPMLKRPESKMGLNPFSKQPMEFKPNGSSAEIWEDGSEIGQVFAAMDGSPKLIVDAEDGREAQAIKLAT